MVSKLRPARPPMALFSALMILIAITLARASELTALYDSRRSGWDGNEPTLTPALLTSGQFGKVYETRIEGQAYAQPLVFGSDIIVATEANRVYAIDRVVGRVRWTRTLGVPAPSDCYAASPQVGILSTPTIDGATGTVYAVARVCDGLSSDCICPPPSHPGFYLRALRKIYAGKGWHSGPSYLMYALRTTDGHIMDGWPVKISGHASNDVAANFDPRLALQRPALLLLDGAVYAGFGAFCGGYPIRGWVAGVNIKTRHVTLWTDEANTSEKSPLAGIWGAGGLLSDGPRSLLLATGDGVLPPPGEGGHHVSTLGNSVVRLTVQDDGSLLDRDHFTPADGKYLNDSDNDLGATAPVVLPEGFTTQSHQKLLLQIDKIGNLYLLDARNLGGYRAGRDGTDNVVGQAGPLGPVYAHSAVWPGDGGYIFVLSYRHKADEQDAGLRALRLIKDANGAVSLSTVGVSETTFGWHTGSPIVTSDGTAPGSAIVWVIVKGGSHRNDELQAYSATPDANRHLELLWHASLGVSAVAKFPVAATDSGHVYVATADGRLVAFGKK